MQTVGIYRLLQALGTSQAGGVWSAVDAGNNPVTVAVLNASTARDPESRHAFAAAANRLAQSGQVPIIAGDFSGPTPWIAAAGTDGAAIAQVFVAMGVAYHPLSTEPGAAGGPDPHSEPETAKLRPVDPASLPHATSGTPTPTSSPPGPFPPVAPMPAVSTYRPPPIGSAPPTARSGRRTWMQVGIAGLLVILVGVGAAVIASTLRSTDSPYEAGEAGSSEVPERTERPSGGSLPTPTASPSQPGLEPPEFGEWPSDWPTFTDSEQTTVLSDLAGIELDIELPASWDCVPVSPAPDYAHYLCGRSANGNLQIGGDLIVRECPPLCLEEQRVGMRQQEEAWGLRWIRTSRYGAMVETTEIDGAEMYGLVVIAYWRSVDEDAIDRQLVLRMTGPVDEADEIRKVANAIRRVARF